jgi:porphobilinogen synthase
MMTHRPRRLRQSSSLRCLVQENHVRVEDLIAPLFVQEGQGIQSAISSMPGHYRWSLDFLLKEIDDLVKLGIRAVALFPALPESRKDARATHSRAPDGLYPKSIEASKNAHPDLIVMSDVAMDPYSDQGHDGLFDSKTGKILNDESLPILAEMAICQAQAGVDIIGPSDMMDGRVGFLRQSLDQNGFSDTAIMSYTAKYASSFYGPFREALDSAPKGGDKKTYQMDSGNIREAIKETFLDIEEGADILMVKPGLSYLDVIQKMKESCELPVAAYNVSGEYAMVKAANEKGWLDGQAVMEEMLISFKRAGADLILTYFAREMAELLKKRS